MKKILAIAAVAATMTGISSAAHASSFADGLRSLFGSGPAQEVSFNAGYDAGAHDKHIENTEKVHRFAGDAYTRATGIGLYGGVGRASRNLAAALDAQGATIDALEATIAGEAGRTAVAVTAGIEAAKDRARGRVSAGQHYKTNLLGIIADFYGLDSDIAHLNSGTYTYDNTAPASVGTLPYDSPDSYGLRGITAAAGDEFFITPDGNLVAHAVINGVTYAAGSNLHQLDVDILEAAGYNLDASDVRVTIRSAVSDALESAWADGYDEGYADGYNDGYAVGFADGVSSVR